MNHKLTLAALVCSLGVLGFSCGSPSTMDAGSGGGGGTAAGGGGGGTTGGGAGGGAGGGTGGGGQRTCTPAPAFAATDINGKPGYDPGTAMSPPYNFATFARASATASRFDVAYFELYSDAPQTNVSIPAATYQQCDLCFVIALGCDGMGANCAKNYLAQSGTFTTTVATKSPDAGSYAFQASNLVYEEWDFMTDKATDGGCIRLDALNFSGTWP